MSNSTRDRAKEYFPAVLLTLLSIVQAIALELLWGHIVDSQFLYSITTAAFLGWAQVAATMLAIILIWVVYASNVMRFRWVPAVTDSIYPFVIGIIEFWLVEVLDQNSVGLWFIVTGLVFVAMTGISQITMRRARFDADNVQFFEQVAPARLSDFAPQTVLFLIFVGFGAATAMFEFSAFVLITAVALTLLFLGWQFFNTTRYWNAAMAPQAEN